jgi:3-deoxy-7-phosphoheptulonate synthase
MAGPCAIESYEQLHATALHVRDVGARVLRGGAFKPRTSPFSFQGMGMDGLAIIERVREETGLPVIRARSPHRPWWSAW